MNLKDLPKELENIVLDYKGQLEHTEKYKKVLKEVREICYSNNPLDNCCSFVLNTRHNKTYKKFHIKFCRTCNKYYRSNVIVYKHHKTMVMRYSYYSSFLVNDNQNEYVVQYGENSLNWTAYFQNKKYNKHISCSCLDDIFENF